VLGPLPLAVEPAAAPPAPPRQARAAAACADAIVRAPLLPHLAAAGARPAPCVAGVQARWVYK